VKEEDDKNGLRTVAIAGGLFLALGAGVGAMAGVRMAAGKEKAVALPVQSASLAAKALLYGTALAWGGAAILVLVTSRVMGVSSVHEFAERMRGTVPQRVEGVRQTSRSARGWLQDKLSWLKRRKD
jgi:hypothetical protein